MQTLPEVLVQVRAAYRLVAQYQERILSLYGHIAEQLAPHGLEPQRADRWTDGGWRGIKRHPKGARDLVLEDQDGWKTQPLSDFYVTFQRRTPPTPGGVWVVAVHTADNAAYEHHEQESEHEIPSVEKSRCRLELVVVRFEKTSEGSAWEDAWGYLESPSEWNQTFENGGSTLVADYLDLDIAHLLDEEATATILMQPLLNLVRAEAEA